VHFPFPAHPHPYPSPLFIYLSLSHFTPLFHFLKELNKKAKSVDRYCGQNALSIIKTHERNRVSENNAVLLVHQSRLAGDIV